VLGNAVAAYILAAPTRGAMSNDDKTIDEDLSDDIVPAEPIEDDAFDEDVVEDDVLVLVDDEVVADDVVADDVVVADEADAVDEGDTADSEGDTEALDDLEAEELEMLTEDEASETIIVDEATQLRDIRRAQISIEASSAGGATEGEFVCASCFLVKKSSQLSNRRGKICLDCAS